MRAKLTDLFFILNNLFESHESMSSKIDYNHTLKKIIAILINLKKRGKIFSYQIN